MLKKLELGIRTGATLILLIRPEDWVYRPQNNMRTLVELVHHYIQITASELAIIQEKTEADVEQVENSLYGIQDKEKLERHCGAILWRIKHTSIHLMRKII